MAGLTDVYNLLSNDPLKGSNLKYYVDVREGRGDDPINPIKRLLLQNPKGQQQILLSGYRGCGKSTDLNKLTHEIKDRFIVVNYSVLKELDPINITYIELFTITMEKLFDAVIKADINISQEFINSIHAWTQSEDIETIKNIGGNIEIEAGVEAKLAIPLFSKFFGKIRAAGNASYNTKRKICETIERRLSDLISNCNDLIREIKLNIGPDQGLLIIIEDLDKLPLSKAEELFFHHSHALTSLNTHIIFTFPISLRYHPRCTIIISNFNECFDLPMIKVFDKHGKPFAQGRKMLI